MAKYAAHPGFFFFFLCFSDLEVKRCPLVYLIRIWITGWLDFPGGVWKQVSADEVIACHASSFSSSCTRSDRFSRKEKKKKEIWHDSLFLKVFGVCLCRRDKDGARVCASHLRSRVCVCVRRMSASASPLSHTRTNTHRRTHTRLNYDVTKMGSLLWHPACRITQRTDLKELISSL